MLLIFVHSYDSAIYVACSICVLCRVLILFYRQTIDPRTRLSLLYVIYVSAPLFSFGFLFVFEFRYFWTWHVTVVHDRKKLQRFASLDA